MAEALDSAVGKLRAILTRANDDPLYHRTVGAKQSVLARFQPVFGSESIADLTEELFREFLLFRNNRHWDGLQRMGPKICADMPRLREALTVLVDESRPVQARLNKLVPRLADPMVPGLGRAVLTAILQVTQPDRYGVWNGTSEAGMKAVGAWPEIERGSSLGDRYLAVNDVLLQLALALGLDLWTLDSLWWRVDGSRLEPTVSSNQEEDSTSLLGEVDGGQKFGLERYLQEFLRDNWNQIFGGEWALYEEDGDVVGCEYDTASIGRIDLLARHKKEPKWLVIELKRDQPSDKTIGQVLRYMGWVEEHLAGRGETVEGLVIAREQDERLRYALRHTRDVRLKLYQVKFEVRDP